MSTKLRSFLLSLETEIIEPRFHRYASSNLEKAENWDTCITCKQTFTSKRFQFELTRLWWRHYRNENFTTDRERKFHDLACLQLGFYLDEKGESDAAKRLFAVGNASGQSKKIALAKQFNDAMHRERQDPQAGIALFEALLPQARASGDEQFYFLVRMQYIESMLHAARHHELLTMVTDCLDVALRSFPPHHYELHRAMFCYATTYGMTDHFDESKRVFDETVASATRIYGPDHDITKSFKRRRDVVLALYDPITHRLKPPDMWEASVSSMSS